MHAVSTYLGISNAEDLVLQALKARTQLSHLEKPATWNKQNIEIGD